MQKQPVVNSKSLIRLLNNLGYEVVRQKGSHIRLKKVSEKGIHKITVPNHEEIAKGILNDIITKISIWNDIPKNELIIMLKEK
mgnify:FL=1